MRLKSGDNVVVISGKDRGKTGVIEHVNLKKRRVVVLGVNKQKKHVKPRGRHPGGIIEREGSIHISNVMMVCPKTGKRTRVGFRTTEKGKKERFSKKSGELIGKPAKVAKKTEAKKSDKEADTKKAEKKEKKLKKK